jgi:uncharacterized protein (TIGR02266 family)
MNSDERRRHARLSIAVEIDFRSDHNFYSARTSDISVGGLFVETDVALPIGTRVTIDLRFLKKHLHADAEVMWALVSNTGGHPVGLGVRFLDLNELAKKSIEAFMVLRRPMAIGMVESDDDAQEEPGPASNPPSGHPL